MKKYKSLKYFAKAKGVKTIEIQEITPPHSIDTDNQPFADNCPIQFPVMIIDRDKKMKVITKKL